MICRENEPEWDLVEFEREPDWQMMRGTVPEKEREPNRAQRNDMAYKKSIDRLIDEPVIFDVGFEPIYSTGFYKKPVKRTTAHAQQLAKWRRIRAEWETKHGKS